MQPRTRALSLAASVAIAVTPVAAAQTSGTGVGQQRSAVVHETVQRSFLQHDRYREYTVVVPDNLDGSREYPIIIAFGGWGDSAASYRDYAGLEQVADGDAIIVYAQGVGNAWAGAPYAATTMDEDVDYVRTVIDETAADYSGDADRVWATGMSNGGGFAAALSCHAPELVDATASIAGAYYNESVTNCRFARKVPMLLVHGAYDDMMSFDGGYRHGAAYLEVERTLRNVAARNGCARDTISGKSADEETTTFGPDGCDVPTEITRIDNYGHTWFDEPAAEQIAVDFFRAL